jgi:hypothetical protein
MMGAERGNMGVVELAKYVGRRGVFSTSEGLKVQVVVLDVKQAYGRDFLAVSPMFGAGRHWTEFGRVSFLSEVLNNYPMVR